MVALRHVTRRCTRVADRAGIEWTITRRPPRDRCRSPSLSYMTLIASAADLNEVRSMPRALVFMYVNWASQTRRSDAACREFLADLQREYQSEEIPVHRVDLSDQEGEVWVGIRK